MEHPCKHWYPKKKNWSKQNQLLKKKSSLTFRQIKNQLDKMQIRSKKLPTKQFQIKTNQRSLMGTFST